MSTAAATLTDRSLLIISEAAAGLVEAASGSAVADDGTVTIHLIRPCVGKGRGRHVYESAMLKKHAESGHFNDWPMYIDHESPQARRAAGGLPRSIRDLGGRIVETWWDGDVPAAGRFGQGAVAAKVLPVPYVQDLIRHDPKLVEASINTHATGVKPKSVDGRNAYVVEGFDTEGSVDWVTRAGAGGKVVQLMEAAMHDDDDADQIKNLLEGWSDDQIATYLRDKRPHLAETLNDAPGTGEEDDDVKPEELAEAISTHLASDAGKQQLADTIGEVAESAVKSALERTLPGAIGKAAGVIEESATKAATKAVRMGALRAKAETAIAEAKLPGDREMPDRLRQDVLDRIGQPDLEDKVGDDGAITESAEQQFDAILESELTRATELAEAFGPAPVASRRRKTAVTENGAGADPRTGAERVQEATDEEDFSPEPYRSALQEAGVDFKAAWGVDTSKAKDKGTEPKADDKAVTA
jgi:hypothetical protein